MSLSTKVLSYLENSGTVGAKTVCTENEDRTKKHFVYCFVFENDPERNAAAETMEELAEARMKIVDKIIEAGLAVEMFYSVEHDEIYVKIGGTDERLLKEAELANYKLPLEPDSLRRIATSSNDPNRKPIYLEPPYDPEGKYYHRSRLGNWREMGRQEVARIMRFRSPYNPFEQLYSKYSEGYEKRAKETFGVQPYNVYPDGSILREADRIKLCLRILERARDGELPGSNGAGLNISELIFKKEILAAFPLPTTVSKGGAHTLTVNKLYEEWVDPYAPAWHQPIEDIRDYFGEKIAFYFSFLGHYTLWLWPCSIVGIAIFIYQLVNIQQNLGVPNFVEPARVEEVDGVNKTVVYTEVPPSPYYALFMALWATFMLELWKRKEYRLALRWGQIGLEKWAKPRPEFYASHILPSPIHGKPEKFYSETFFYAKLAGSAVVIGTWIAVVLGAVAGIFVLRVFLSLPEQTGLDEDLGRNLALLVNALVIQLLGFVYKFVAKKLTDWENHRTEMSYENSLILKTYLFSFINSYATLFYMAFVKTNIRILNRKQFCFPGARESDAEDACFGTIGTSLLIIFATQLFVKNTVDTVLPLALNLKRRRENSNNIQTSDEKDQYGNTKINHKSPAEDQFYRAPYEGTSENYLPLALQFGYVTMFVVAFPLAPVLAFLTNWLEIFLDAFRLCKLNRRPDLQNAEAIGIWQQIFESIGFVAVMTNAALIVFASDLLPIREEGGWVSPSTARVWFFIIFVTIVMMIKRYVRIFLPDRPWSVDTQLERQKFLIRKCLEGVPDHKEEENSEEIAVDHVDVPIYDSDPQIDSLLHHVANAVVKVLKSQNIESDELFADVVQSDHQVKINDFTDVLNNNLEADEEMIQVLAQALDNNSNGKIDLSEFKTLVQAKADSDDA